jgi:hypothetical protein
VLDKIIVLVYDKEDATTGSKTMFSDDTFDLYQKYLKYVNG